VPGFLVNVIVIMIGNKIYTQKNKGVLAEFDEVQRIYERDI
jgi:sodium/proline symporter